MGWSSPPLANPSTVSTSAPSAWTASTEQDFTLRPSRWTVQAPQLLVSQPMTVPTFPSFSRRYCTSSIRGSTSSEYRTPSTLTDRTVMGSPSSLGAIPSGATRGTHVFAAHAGDGADRPLLPDRPGPGETG